MLQWSNYMEGVLRSQDPLVREEDQDWRTGGVINLGLAGDANRGLEFVNNV